MIIHISTTIKRLPQEKEYSKSNKNSSKIPLVTSQNTSQQEFDSKSNTNSFFPKKVRGEAFKLLESEKLDSYKQALAYVGIEKLGLSYTELGKLLG